MASETGGQLGRIEVSPRAVAAVVAEAVMGCYGVVGMAPRNLRDGLDVILHRDSLDRGIRVRMHEGRFNIDVYVVVEYGTRIREVGKNVADAVRFAIEKSLGIGVDTVTVNIQGLRVSDEA
jgi:uncharacterized alkaline shock family protein YloU